MPRPAGSRTGQTKYLSARARCRAQWMDANVPCALCGKPINWDAGQYEPDSFMFGHIRSVVEYGEPSRYDQTTMRPEHRRCGIVEGQLARDRARARGAEPRQRRSPSGESTISTGHGFVDDHGRMNPTTRAW